MTETVKMSETVKDARPFVDRFVEAAQKFGSFSFDVEHSPETGPHAINFSLWGCAFATEGVAAYVRSMPIIKEICERLFYSDVVAVGHNVKYDIMCLKRAGLIDKYPDNLACTMIMMNLLHDWRTDSQLGLKTLVKDVFGVIREDFKLSSKEGQYSAKFEKYARDDALDTLKLWVKFKPDLVSQKLMKLYEKILMPSCKTFADMEIAGIGWDIPRAYALEKGYMDLKNSLEKEILHELGPINISSPKQLADRLFNEIGVSTAGINKTPKGDRYSVDAAALNLLAARYPVAKKILLYRTCGTMVGTFVKPLTEKARDVSHDKRIHAVFWLTSTTGRTRSSKPNLQNIPVISNLDKDIQPYFKGLDIRANFVPKPGYVYLVGDFSQIELRMIAHITKEPYFIKGYCDWRCTKCGGWGSTNKCLHSCPDCGEPENEAVLKGGEGFWQGLDLHQSTADSISVFEGNRGDGKTANFELVYGSSAYNMNIKHPKYSKEQWQDAINVFFKKVPYVREWHNQMERVLMSTGTCTDVFGRKRRIPKYEIRKSKKHALNQLVNFGPQASACHLGQLCLSKLWDRWTRKGSLFNEVLITNFVHDEAVFEVLEDKADDYSAEIRDTFETAVDFRVPIRFEIKKAPNWGVKG